MSDFTSQHEYETTLKICGDLDRSGVLERLSGNCISAADIFQNLLESHKVKSRIIECNLIVTKKVGDMEGLRLIGYNFISRTNTSDEIDTHVVVLVEAEKPFIIDASIGYILGNPKPVVTFPLSGKDPDIIAEDDHEDYHLIYRNKKNIRLAPLHQKTLLERVNDDIKIRKEVTFLSWMVKILIGVAVFNMIANSVLIILKLIYP